MSQEKFARRHVRKRLQEIEEQAAELQKSARDALRIIADLDEIKICRWRCVFCGYVTRFSQPSTIKACGPCSHCKTNQWVPDGTGDTPAE